jgi:outer membrane protein assembly factor BamB
MLRRRRLLIGLAVVATLLAAGGAYAYLEWVRPPGDVFNSDVEFHDTPEATATATPEPKPKPEKQREKDTFEWPMYGYTKEHRRVFDPPQPLRGPWKQVWRRAAPHLAEFPPSIAHGWLYQLYDNGEIRAINKHTGRFRWKRTLGALAASTPTYADGKLYATVLEIRKDSPRGRVVAMRAEDGKRLWTRELPSRSESSPMVDGGRVYFGSEDGTLYAVRQGDGKVLWTYRAAGAIKGSPTLANGILYFGDYGGRVQAVRASDGRHVWTADDARGTLRTGTFYATAAVAYGRVYIGSTDGRQYSFSAKTGRLAWAHQTGRYVYASPAVRTVDGLGPTVYVGSYDGTFYALDARSGAVRWTYRSGGRISGSATVIGDTVYFSDLGHRRTYGLNTRTGRQVFEIDQGAYDPAISDGQYLFLTGAFSISAWLPRENAEPRISHSQHDGAKRRAANGKKASKDKKAPAKQAAEKQARKKQQAAAKRKQAAAKKQRQGKKRKS